MPKNNEILNMPTIGYLKILDLGAAKEWLRNRCAKWAVQFLEKESADIIRTSYSNDHFEDVFNKFLFDAVRVNESWYRNEEEIAERRQRSLDSYYEPIELYSKLDLSFDIKSVDCSEFIIVATGNGTLLLPAGETWCEVTLLKDYKDTPLLELYQNGLKANQNTGEIKTVGGLTPRTSLSSAQQTYSDKLVAVETLEASIKKVQEGQSEELEDIRLQIEKMQAEMEQKKESMLAALYKKQDEMNQQLRAMKKDIFFLETEIYAIRCYLGEVINFTQIRSGQSAGVDTPVVLFQKMRFLDEDMARLTSLYYFDGEDMDLFETAIANNDIILDEFCPGTKCVSLVKISKSERAFTSYNTVIPNMVESYEVAHGKKIGILIRDGDNLYIGWTDEDYIHMKDDFFFPQANAADSKPPKKTDEESLFNAAMIKAKEAAGRYFLFSILQGAIERDNPLLQFPKKVDILNSPDYVKFSMADGWLSDNRYGNFGDLVDLCNSSIKEGDSVLSTINLRPSSDNYNNNDRGIGYNNRTHDTAVFDNTVYAINKIVVETNYYHVYSAFSRIDNKVITQKSYAYGPDDVFTPEEGTTYIGMESSERHQYYVSVPKRYSEANARANFQVYPDEFINLSIMNSEWLKYAITNKNTGGWHAGSSKTDYAYLVRYLKKALQFVEEREKDDAETISRIDSTIVKDPEWVVALSNWKLESGVRNITEYQAKRFVKWYSQQHHKA